jgi:lysophospholipase L1-like esterase
MRRAFFWYVPLAVALTAAAAFGAGFYSFLRGDTGEPVDLIPRAASAVTTPQTQIAPIILGDSLARGAGDMKGLGIGGRLDAELKRRKINAKATVNIAVNGSRTGDLSQQLTSANVRRLLGESNVIIVSIGGNDLWGGTDWRNAAPPNPEAVMDDVLGRVEAIVKTVREASPRARIYFVGLYNPFTSTPFGKQLTPLVLRWNAKLADRLAGDVNLTVVQTADLFSHHDRLAIDRFHPGDEGYELIARRIADSI